MSASQRLQQEMTDLFRAVDGLHGSWGPGASACAPRRGLVLTNAVSGELRSPTAGEAIREQDQSPLCDKGGPISPNPVSG